MIDSWLLVLFFFWNKCAKNLQKIAKNLQRNCKKIAKKLQKIAKKLQNNCKNFAKCAKKIFLLCKIFANYLQILNLHIDFRPREESVRSSQKISLKKYFFCVESNLGQD